MVISTTHIAPSTSEAPKQMETTTSNKNLDAEEDHHIYPPMPLSTVKVLIVSVVMGIFSFVYLIPAQHNRILFFFMTGIVGVVVSAIYIAGFLSVMYMVADPYSEQIRAEQLQRSKQSSAPNSPHSIRIGEESV